MRNAFIAFTSFIAAFALVATFAPVPTTSAQIQIAYDADDVRFFSIYTEDDDTGGAASEGVVFWAKYVGAQESGTVDLNTNAIEFFSGPLGTEIAAVSGDGDDVNVTCAGADDPCGAARSALDVTDAQCNTPQEIVTLINCSDDWVAALSDVTGAETLATAAEYVDMADAQAKLPGGYPVRIDQTDVDTMAVLIRPDAYLPDRPNTNNNGRGDIEFFLTGVDTINSYSQEVRDNPFRGTQTVIQNITALADSTTAWRIRVYAVKYSAGGVRTDRVVYERNDTVDVTEEVIDLSRAPLVSGVGEAFLVEILDDALVTGRIQVSGIIVRARQ